MRELSGENTGCVSSRSCDVSRRVAPVETSTSTTREMLGVFACGLSRLVIAIVLPSGDQDSGDGAGPGGWAMGRLQAPLVMRRAVPPLEEITHTCDGVTASRIRKSSSLISNERLFLSSFATGSSALTNAICDPSGLHANCCTPCLASVSRRGSPPRIDTTQI